MKLYNKTNIKRIKQKAIGYCGPASLQMLLSVYDVYLPQDEIMNSIGILKDEQVHGTRIDQLAQVVESVVKEYILLAKYNSTILDLHLIIQEHCLPAGIEWQGSFTEPNGHVYDEGHYSVVIDIDDKLSELIIIDPDERTTFRNGILSLNEMEKRWWEINRISCLENGSAQMVDMYNEKLVFIVIPRTEINTFTNMGFELATLELIKDNQKKDPLTILTRPEMNK